MEFPAATQEHAAWIADQIKIRNPRRLQQIKSLYDGDFLSIQYGINDLLKKGTGAMYLHELTRKADCFSLSAALYAIAEKLDLKPEMYWADGIVDRAKNQPDKGMRGNNHCFISVKYRGDELIIDPFMGWFGRIRHRNGRIEKTTSDLYGKELVMRTYDTLHKPNKKELLERIEFRKTLEGFKFAFSGAQKITHSQLPIYLHVQDGQAITRAHLQQADWTHPANRSKHRCYSLCWPVAESSENAKIRTYDLFDYSYNIEDEKEKDLAMEFNYSELNTFRKVLDEASAHLGRKTSLLKTREQVAFTAAKKLGIDSYGRGSTAGLEGFIEESAIKSELLFSGNTSSIITIKYYAQRFENGDDHLYSEQKRNELLEDAVNCWRQKIEKNVSIVTRKTLQNLGLSNERMDIDMFRSDDHALRETHWHQLSEHFDDPYLLRTIVPGAIDKQLFFRDHESEDFQLTDQEILAYKKRRALNSWFTVGILKQLPLRDYAKGLSLLAT